MLARITPSPLKGNVPAIASKSMAHRLIICAALANGETHVTCNTTCADIEATVRCLTALGARIETVEDGFQVHPTMKSIEFGLLKALAGGTLDCGESGSTLRFMLPVACALGAEATFVGQGRLGARPLFPLSDEIIAAGCDLQGLGGFPLKTSGRMRPGTFMLPGNVSSQYISGLLLAAPLLAQPSCVQVTGLIESRPYINLTIQAMKAFGVEVNVERIPAKDGQPEIVADPYPATEGQLFFVDGLLPEHYYAERHLLRYLMIFFDQLKEAGIYDNTRIILVSDHGESDSPMVERTYNDGKEFPDGTVFQTAPYAPGRPHALLMVKEPHQRGELRISDAFMSSADVPTLALQGVGTSDEFEMRDPAALPKPRILTHARGGARWSEHKENAYIFEQYRMEGTLFDASKCTREGAYQ